MPAHRSDPVPVRVRPHIYLTPKVRQSIRPLAIMTRLGYFFHMPGGEALKERPGRMGPC